MLPVSIPIEVPSSNLAFKPNKQKRCQVKSKKVSSKTNKHMTKLYNKEGKQLNMLEVIELLPIDSALPLVNRVEVIGNGREYTNWKKDNNVTISLQNDKRTLKIFIS